MPISPKQKEFERLVFVFTYHQEIGAKSLMPHVPSIDSGVTFGPGFDVRCRPATELDQIFLITHPLPSIRIIRYWQLEVFKKAATKQNYASRKKFVKDFDAIWIGKSHQQRFENIYQAFLAGKPFPRGSVGVGDKELWQEEFFATYQLANSPDLASSADCSLLRKKQQEDLFKKILVPLYQSATLKSIALLLGRSRHKRLRNALASATNATDNKDLADHLWSLMSAETCAMLFDIQYNPNLLGYPTFFEAAVGIPIGEPVQEKPNWWLASVEHVRHKTVKGSPIKRPIEKRTQDFFNTFIQNRLDSDHPFEAFYAELWPFLNKRDRIARRIYPTKQDGDFTVFRISTFQRLLIEQDSLDFEIPGRDVDGIRQDMRFRTLPSGDYEITRDGGGKLTVNTAIKGNGRNFTEQQSVVVTCERMTLTAMGLKMEQCLVSPISLAPRLRHPESDPFDPGKLILLDRSVEHDLNAGLIFSNGLLNAGPVSQVVLD